MVLATPCLGAMRSKTALAAVLSKSLFSISLTQVQLTALLARELTAQMRQISYLA